MRPLLAVLACAIVLVVTAGLTWFFISRTRQAPNPRRVPPMNPPRKDVAVDVTVAREAPTDELLALLEEPTRPAVLINDEPEPVDASPVFAGRSRWATSSRSHRGYRRDNNEDAVLTSPHLVAVADGVGGGPAGGIASAIVLGVIDAALREPTGDPADLRTAVAQAGAALFGATMVEKDLKGMATTLDMVVLGAPVEGAAEVHGAHVGDAAVWLIRPDRDPRLLTKPHLAANGALTHAVGGRTLHSYCDLWTATLRVGDRLVLTTDGFHGQLAKDDATRLLDEIRDLAAAEAADAIIRAALRGGGHDNVSAVVADLVPVDRGAPPKRRQPGRVRRILRRRSTGPAGPGTSGARMAN